MSEFLGFVDDAGHFALDDRAGFLAHARRFAGKEVIVSIEERRRTRSLNQNKYLHAEPFPKLAAKWGESVARTKLICMGEFWGWEPCKVTGQILPVKAHTSDMTVAECTTFIDWLLPWALTEHGVDVEPPDPNWRERDAEAVSA